MQIGTALFFGLTLIALAILYNTTKDRWNWKQIVKKSLLIPVILIGIWLLTLLYFVTENKIKSMPSKQFEIDGIKIGDLKDDIIFKKGESKKSDIEYPNNPLEKGKNNIVDVMLPDGRLVKNVPSAITKANLAKKLNAAGIINGEEEWLSTQEKNEVKNNKSKSFEESLRYDGLQILITENKVSVIQKTCNNGESLNNVECGDNLKDLESKLDKSTLIKCSKDNLRRIYYYPHYQTAYGLTQNSVTEFIIYDSNLGKTLEAEGFIECASK